MSTRAIVYTVSILVHAGLAAAVVGIRPPAVSTPVVITLTSVEPPKPPPVPPPTPPKPPDPEPIRAPAPKAAPPPRVAKSATPPPAAVPAPTAAPAPEFGVELAGATGPGGIAVPVGDPKASPTAPRHVQAKELKNEPLVARDSCTEPASKPKPVQVSQPAFPEEARAAGIQGRVRVELTVDDSGSVVQARVVEGLGHGLDEAALETARTYKFEPALRCGKPTSATFTISIRFTI